MNDDRRLLDLLSDVLATPPRVAPDGLLTAVIEDVRVTRQRGGRRPSMGRPGRRSRMSPWRVIAAAALVCVIGTVAVVGLTPLSGIVLPPATSTPRPSVSETPQPSRTPSPGTVMDSLTHLEPGVTYASDAFLPRMTFMVNPRYAGGTVDDWCTPIPTSTRTIRFTHPHGCSDGLLVITPASVDCGTPDAHPDSEALAAAILANPAVGAADLGTLQDPDAVPRGMFAEAYAGRVVQIGARMAPSVGGTPCRLLDDPGTSKPLLEITGDLSMRLILVDIHGQLVVFRTLGAVSCCGDTQHLLRITHGIRFD